MTPEQKEALSQRDRDLEREEATIGDGTIDADALRTALAGFEPIWTELVPAEQERILQLLIERITYDPDAKEVEIALRTLRDRGAGYGGRRRAMKLRARFGTKRNATRTTKEPRAEAEQEGASPAARNLALAHYLARLIDHGVLADQTQAAEALGVSQPRVTHLLGLTLLSPEIQKAILLGGTAPGGKELRAVARESAWDAQGETLVIT